MIFCFANLHFCSKREQDAYNDEKQQKEIPFCFEVTKVNTKKMKMKLSVSRAFE